MSLIDAGTAGSNAESETSVNRDAAAPRKPTGVYQNGRCVAEVTDAQVDAQAREIHFDEVYQSDNLLIPEDCEFREYRILIQRIGFASRQEAGAAHKGRVLKNVVAEILGYREQ